MEKATIFDYARMCKTVGDCAGCPMSLSNNGTNEFCCTLLQCHPDKANEIILKWCKEHPIITRQSKIQKIIPNLVLNDNGCLDICPNVIDGQYGAYCTRLTCKECKKKYWLAEVDEHDK